MQFVGLKMIQNRDIASYQLYKLFLLILNEISYHLLVKYIHISS